MSDALRQLLAEFVVSIDPKGDLAKGQVQVDALAGKLEALADRVAGVGRAAAPALARINALGAAWGNVPGLGAAVQQGSANAAAGLFGNFGAAQGLDRAERPDGPALGPTRATLNAHLAEQRAASDAAARSLSGRLTRGFQAAAVGAASFGARAVGAFQRAREAAFRTDNSLFTVQNALGALAGGTVVRATLGLIDHIGGIGEAAAKLGVTTDEFQRLDVLAKQNATSVEALGGAFRVLARQAVDPSKDSAAAFKALGVSTKDAAGDFKSRQTLFFDTALALADVSDETKRAALAQQLFGRGGTELLPLLSQGRAGLEAQRGALEKLALVTPEAIKAADDLGDRWEAVKTGLLARFAPALTKVVIPALEKLTDLVVRFSERSNLFTVAAGAVVVGLNSMGGAAGRATVAFARLALPFLLLEDVLGFFNGDDSVTGRLLTWLFGDDGGAKIQQAAVDIKNTLGEVFSGDFLGPSFTQIKKDLSEFFEFLDKSNFAAHGLLAGVTGLKTLFVDTPIALGNGLANATGLGAAAQDNRTQSVTVHVNSAAEVGPAVKGATQALGRNAAADLAAVGG